MERFPRKTYISAIVRMGLATFCVLLCLTAVVTVQAWGPASHYLFTCEALTGRTKGCVNDAANVDLLSGTELPDAFFFGPFITGNPCVQFGVLHNAVFGGVMYQVATNQSYGYTPRNGTRFNATAFALGFGAHVVGDAAGFWPGGYLGTGFETNPGLHNWVSLWPFMTSVDSYVYHNEFPAGSNFPAVLTKELGSDAWDFIAASSKVLNALVPSMPVVNSSQAATCATQWSRAVTIESNKAVAMPWTSYSWDMIYNDRFNATTAAEAVEHFQMGRNCAIEGIKVWVKAITGGTSPLAALDTVEAFYAKSFAAGKCAPKK